MKNIKQIKIILQQFEPDIITTFKFDKSTCAMINKVIGIPFINVNSIQNIEKYFLDKKLDDFEIVEGKNIAVKITNYLMHEDYGHKNFSYKMRSESPCRFIHSNIAYKLEEARSTSKESNIIKILPDNRKSYSGTFFELIYGRIGDYYIYEILDQFDKYGKLIDRVDLWVGDFTTFNEFIKYKYFFYKKNIVVAGYEKLTIEKEIDLMKDKALKENLDVDAFYKKIKTVYEKNKKKKIKEDLETGLKKNIIKDNKEKQENEKKEKKEKQGKDVNEEKNEDEDEDKDEDKDEEEEKDDNDELSNSLEKIDTDELWDLIENNKIDKNDRARYLREYHLRFIKE